MRKGSTRIRIKGARQLVSTAAEKIPGVDELVTAKRIYEGTYRLVKGREPLSWGEMMDRRLSRKERAMDRRFTR